MAGDPLVSAPEPLPAGGPTREEVAQREVGHTDVAPRTARLLVALFLVAIAMVPAIEALGVRALRAQGLEPSWSHLTGLPQAIRSSIENPAEAGSHVPEAGNRAEAGSHILQARSLQVRAEIGLWTRIVSVNRRVLAGLSAFENALEDESVLGRALRPPAQLVLTEWLGAGNERVYKGSGPWLFYRPDVEYITGRPFLEPRTVDRRISSASEWDRPPQPDPRPAIAQFRRDLEARGIVLVVMPSPVKPSVHPEGLAPQYEGVAGVLQNPSYGAFLADLRRDGTLVFDPGQSLGAARRVGPQYLETDTHWRPEAMEEVAELLARFITSNVDLPAVADPGYRVDRQEVRNAGDTARMLDLPEDADVYPPETVWLRRILQPDGSLWRSSRGADVLLLGDSFTNIYALESMGWGTSAGLAEQLSYALARPVDRLVQNDDAAFATRAIVAGDPARLAGKRVVVHQFATRELAFGDWRILPVR
jgi:alginate O-acetyltransferase complex protein AlgJ